ncbi:MULTISPECIES: folate-binding protein YgfZ [Caldimonas]|uniref:CAF17-like 4Fe-4S cluster assembly/insertion protein YgfZ n=1 Tax=Caldimonas TaxID=196013 RepID=UPI00036E02D1|nr:folate-binding protein YgfZ [Caldimonas manganoxidans]
MTAALDETLIMTAARLEGATALPHLGVIHASGEDAASFLHGQLTQDIVHLPRGEARLAGYCSPKGRLLATFVVWREADDRIALVCSADLLASTLKRLSMFVLRAKVQLSDVSSHWRVWAWVGEAVRQTAPAQPWALTDFEGGRLIRLPDVAGQARALWVGPSATLAPALQARGPLDEAGWLWLEVQSGIPRITAATVDQFVPQMVNLESVGGVHFKKGCYPGQEVVARSQFRGTIKRRGFLVHGPVALAPGQDIFHSADPAQPSGLVVLAAPDPRGGSAGLVELKLSATEGGTLHAAAMDTPALRLSPVPYPLLADV